MTRTAAILEQLRRYESRNITFVDPKGSWPIVWSRARGVHVWDVEGRKYLDLTAAFGVAAAGHANPRVIRAAQRQMGQLLHAMGDVHPHALKARLARTLSELTFERWAQELAANRTHSATRRSSGGRTPKHVSPERSAHARAGGHGKVIFCNSGFEAVEAALKTALLVTKKAGVIAFEGAYHGTGYGTLNTTHRQEFRGPFRSQLAAFGQFVPFPAGTADLDRVLTRVQQRLRRRTVGAVLVEPVQARGGIRVAPPSFLAGLRDLCNEHEALLIVDEVFTGFGRTGAWFGCDHFGVRPDLICLGKALTGGFPLSACVGTARLMDAAWPLCQGEAIHTSTYLGHPVGCAMAMAQIDEIKRGDLVAHSRDLGAWLLTALQSGLAGAPIRTSVRGLGLMVGVEITERKEAHVTRQTWMLIKQMLHRGYLILPEGAHGQVAAFTPPLVIRPAQLAGAVQTFCELFDGPMRLSRREGRV